MIGQDPSLLYYGISLRVKQLYSKTMMQPILLIAQNHLLFMINYSCDLGNVCL